MESFREQRIRKITQLYYSRKDIQEAIFEFSKDREISPRYFEGFGKRPDSFQYIGDIFELVKKGATSFHCSEELWKNPLNIITGMDEKALNELREGWDLLIDIDCKWFDYSKLAAKAIIETFHKHNLKNIGVKFSGSKGFHILIPWKAFPEEINGVKTSNMFPEIPRKLAAYIRFFSEKILKDSLPNDFYAQFKNTKIKKGIKCNSCNEISENFLEIHFKCTKCERKEIHKKRIHEKIKKLNCPECSGILIVEDSKEFFECPKCNKNSKTNPDNFSKTFEIDLYELMGLDIILVSPRHLFRMPYSLHEKTALASVVIDADQVSNFDMKDANPMKVKVKNFMPEARKGEASELLIQALDWAKYNIEESQKKATGKYADYKPIILKNISENQFSPCIKKILEGVADGKKRALFVLINLFRSIGMEKETMEKKIDEWNKKNNPPLKSGYVHSQLSWSYNKKPIMPPNCKEFYQGIGVCMPDDFCRTIKNPVNYVTRKNFKSNKVTRNNNKF